MRFDFIKFIRKAFFFLLPFIILTVLAEIFISQSVFCHYSKVFEKAANFLKNSNHAQILVLGSSHADNAVSNCYSQSIFNMANQGQDFKHDLFLLKFIGDLKNIDVVVFSISYFSFSYSEEKEWPFRVRDYLDLYTLKPEKKIYHLKNWLYDRCMLLNYDLSPYQILKYYLSNKKITKESDEMINLKKDAERRALPLQARYHNTESQIIEKYFKEMIDICQNQKKKMVLVVLPFSKEYNSGIEDKWKSDFKHDLNYYKEKYRLPILDYSHDDRFENDDTLFMNADHLNKKGAAKFTGIFLGDLKKESTNFHGGEIK